MYTYANRVYTYANRVYTYANRVNARENKKNNRPCSASFCKKIEEKLAPTFTTVLFGSDNTTEERDGWKTVLCDARWGCRQRSRHSASKGR